MGKQTLVLDEEWYSDEVVLIALHTTSELYKLAYQINLVLEVRLEHRRELIDVWRDDIKLSFPLYEYRDSYHDLSFYLIGNRITRRNSENLSNELLFDNYSTYFESFIPERRDVDAFLKIEGSDWAMDWLPYLRRVKSLSALYTIDIKTLKSYSNLIFE